MYTSEEGKYKGTIYDDFDDDEKDSSSGDSEPKKNHKIIIVIILVLVLLGLIGFLIYINRDTKPKEDNLTIDALSANIELEVGKTHQIKYTASKSHKNITFFTSNSDVATVTSSGLVKGVKEGSADITLSYSFNGKMNEKTIPVTIKQGATDNFTISNKSITLAVGKTQQIKYTESSEYTNISFASSDPTVATVTDNGTVTGVKDGNCKITVSYTFDGIKKTKTVSVKVTENKPQPTSLTLNVNPTGGSNSKSFSNKDVTVNVTTSGATGTAKITYKINCFVYMDQSTCEKKSFNDSGSFKVTNNGTTTIDFTVKDNKKTITKQVVIYIDKTAPTCSLSVDANGKVTAKTKDSLAGAATGTFLAPTKQNGDSLSLSASSTSTVKVEYEAKDKAGNTATCSKSFKATCTSGKCTWS